ncbi:MAG TPA: hypothetical protein VHW23_10805 [Kofleriaceae bacterium]|jgi:hypothetical protein|nr:hypothetical protein [Kofleriaceae bacterium]
MKNLVLLGALLAAAVSSTACGSSGGDTSAVITANWSFNTFANRLGAPNGACPSGFGTAAIYARPWDPFVGDFVASAEPPDLFNCSDLHGTTLPLDGVFQVWVQIETDDATVSTPPSQIYVQSGSVVIDTADGDATIDLPTVYTDAGYMDFAWNLEKNGAHVHCTDVNVGHNGIASTAVNPDFMIADKFDCGDGFGTTAVLPAGEFLVTVTATDTAGTDVGASDPIDNVPISAPDGPQHALTSLGVVQVHL